MNFKVPILGFAAFSGTGKTSLLIKLIPLLRADGLKVGVIKHSHHKFDVDKSGKDSFKIRHSGASETLVASRKRWALMVETPDQDDANLAFLVNRLDLDNLDVVLVEGFRDEAFPKIELHRMVLDKPYLYKTDKDVIALVVDEVRSFFDLPIPVLDMNNILQIKQFVLNYVESNSA